jgi:hypothetical protein
MDKILNKSIKVFFVIDFVLIIILTIMSLMIIKNSIIHSADFELKLRFIISVLFFIIVSNFIEELIGIILFIICSIRKNIKYIITKNTLCFIPIILFLIYTIYLIFEYRNEIEYRKVRIVYLLMNNIGIILWLNILIYSNVNIKKINIFLYSLLAPIKCFFVYLLLRDLFV